MRSITVRTVVVFPLWAPDGQELFYRRTTDPKIWVVDIKTKPEFSASKPQVLYEGPFLGARNHYRSYDIMPDGQRFIAVELPQGPTKLNVVFNWFEELKQKVPKEK